VYVKVKAWLSAMVVGAGGPLVIVGACASADKELSAKSAKAVKLKK